VTFLKVGSIMVVEKIKFKTNKVNKKELEEFKAHSKLMDEKMEAIIERYKTSWDTSTKTWKKGMGNA